MSLYKVIGFGFNQALTVQHSGTPVVQRVLLKLPAETVLAAGDVILLGELPQDYVLDSIQIDTVQTVAEATVNVGILEEDQSAVEFAAIKAGSLATAGFVRSNSAEALRAGRQDGNRTLAAVVVAGGTAAAGTEIGFTLSYRNAQFGE